MLDIGLFIGFADNNRAIEYYQTYHFNRHIKPNAKTGPCKLELIPNITFESVNQTCLLLISVVLDSV